MLGARRVFPHPHILGCTTKGSDLRTMHCNTLNPRFWNLEVVRRNILSLVACNLVSGFNSNLLGSFPKILFKEIGISGGGHRARSRAFPISEPGVFDVSAIRGIGTENVAFEVTFPVPI